AVLPVRRGLHVGEEIVLVDASHAAAQQLGDRQGHPVLDEGRGHDRALDRPDVLLQPDLERQVVGDPAQQGHGIVGVGVDQAGDQRRIGTRHRFLRREAAARLGDRQDRDDDPIAHGHGMVLQYHAVRLDRDDETRFDQQVAGLGRGNVRHAAILTGRIEGTRVTRALHYWTRLTYSPERVSTLMISSWPTNSGTRTTAPVSSVAGLPPPPEGSPRTPGSVWVIFSSTKLGGVTWIGVPFHSVTTHSSSPLSHFSAPPMPAASACTC